MAYCKHCMRMIEDDAQFCPACGKPQNGKVKKPIYKKWWLWVIVVMVLLVSCMGSSTAPSETKLTREECELVCQEIDYKVLARNPDGYKNQYFKFTGEIIQAMEGGGYWNLRLNVTPVYSSFDNTLLFYEDTLFVSIGEAKNGARFLEGDIITIYGMCVGTQSYESIIGAEITIPRIDAYYFDLVG